MFSIWFTGKRLKGAASVTTIAAAAVALLSGGCASSKSDATEWRSLPLTQGNKVHPDWVHIGYGGFAVDNGALRTECDPKGLGLLVYKKERLGDCQIRVRFKAKDAKSNAGVYVRMADGILGQVGNPGPAFERDAAGNPTKESLEKVKAEAEKEVGPWYAVHRGYEVQIIDAGDPLHGTGAIYSLARSAGAPPQTGEWRTMIITLAGEKINVEVDGKPTTSFDPTSSQLPARKEWHEPKREPKRPMAGYIGLQNHDPGDVVWFKEVSIRALPVASRN